MPRGNRKRTFLRFQANAILNMCLCRVFQYLSIHYFILLFSVNNSIAIPANDASYSFLWMACKKDNSHPIHRQIAFSGSKSFQMQADRFPLNIPYRDITIAISISIGKI